MLVQEFRATSSEDASLPALISFTGVPVNNLSRRQMDRAVAADARRFEAHLLAAAEAAAIPAAFRRTAGDLDKAVGALAEPGDVLVFGFPQTKPGSRVLLVWLTDQEEVPEFASRLADDWHLLLRVRRLDTNRQALTGQNSPSAPGAGPSGATMQPADPVAELGRQAAAALIVSAAAAAGVPQRAILEAARCPVVFEQPG